MVNNDQFVSDRRLGLGLAWLASALWSVLAIALKVSVGFLDAYTIVWVRFSFAATCLALLLAWRRPAALSLLRRPPLTALLGAACLAYNYFGFVKGLELTAPSTAQVFGQFGPLLLVVIGVYLFKEPLGLWQKLGFVVAFVGFGLFYQDQLMAFASAPTDYWQGNLWTVTASSAWAIYALFQKLLSKRHDPLALNLITYVVAALLLLPFIHGEALLSLSWPELLLVGSLGLNTLVAYGALGVAFKHLEANKISIIITLNPIFTIVLMQLLSGLEVSWIAPESIHVLGLLGAALVIVGAILVVGRTKLRKPAVALPVTAP